MTATENSAPSSSAPTVEIAVESATLPGRTRPSAVVRMRSARPSGLIVLDSSALDALESALQSIDQSGVESIIVIGSERSFAAGADLEEIRAQQRIGSTRAYMSRGHEVFGLLAEASVPTIAVVTQQALGGGLELALHAGYRIGHERGGPIGLPECRLGIFPGWGGVHLLPHLIGPEAALRLAVFDSMKGRTLRPAEAAELGILDVLLPQRLGGEEGESAWQEAAAEILARTDDDGFRRPGQPGAAEEQEWTEAAAKARSKAEALWGGAAPAPLAAIDLIEAARTQTREQGAQQAIADFDELAGTEISQAALRTFRLVDARSRRSVGRPDAQAREVRKVAVIGAGLMARQLAALFARSLQVPVVLTDVDAERLDNGIRWIADRFRAQAQKGRMSPEQAEKLAKLVSGARSDDDIADADFLIEATPEQMSIKTQVLSHWSALLDPGAVIATNTSSLSVAEMAQSVEHPERFLGFHVFNPVDATPLLEIITPESTGDAAVATAFDLAQAMRRTPVRAADAPGFVVNRVLLRMFDPVLAALEAGMDLQEADHALDPMGLPMTPLQLLDFVGPAVLRHVAGRMHSAYPERFHDSPWLAALQRDGVTRTLPERGAEGTDYLAPEAEQLRQEVVGAASAGNGEPASSDAATTGAPEIPSAEQLLVQVQDALAEEIAILLQEQVVDSAEDVDVCMVLGANWPFHLGGITPYLDRVGASERMSGKRFGAVDA